MTANHLQFRTDEGSNDQWLELGPAQEFGTDASFTIEFWLRLDAYQPSPVTSIIGTRHVTYPDSINVGLSDGALWAGHLSNYLNGRTQLQVDQWYHVAYRCDVEAKRQAFVLNGVVDAQGDLRDTGTITDPLILGSGFLDFENIRHAHYDIAELRIWNGARSDGAVKAAMFQRLQGDEPGLVGYWPLQADGEPPEEIANAVDGRVASPTGSLQWADDASLPLGEDVAASAVAFADGADVEVPGSAQVVASASFTVEAWVQATVRDSTSHPSPSQDGAGAGWESLLWEQSRSPIVSQCGAGAGWELRANSRGCGMMVTIGSRDLDVDWYFNTPFEGWFHLAAVYDGTEARMHVNGVMVAVMSAPGQVTPYPKPVLLGRNREWTEGRFTGSLAEVRVWNRVRTDQEILASMYTAVTGDEADLALAVPLADLADNATTTPVLGLGGPAMASGVTVVEAAPVLPLRRGGEDSSTADDDLDRDERIRSLEASRNDLLQQLQAAHARLGEVDKLESMARAGQRAMAENERLRERLAALEETDNGDDGGPEEEPEELDPGETTLQHLITRTRAEIDGARASLVQGGANYRLRDVTMELRVIPSAGGGRVIIPDPEQLIDLSGDRLSTLRLDFAASDLAPKVVPATVEVPDVTGYTEVMARRRLREQGLFAEVVLEALPTSSSGDGRVVNQLPESGDDTDPQSTVTIFVGRLARTDSQE